MLGLEWAVVLAIQDSDNVQILPFDRLHTD
jgi:hypothetical protein